MSLAFRFDRDDHVYTAADTGEELPHITNMLVRTGWVDDTWYTEDGSDRGTAVHQLAAAYDLGALDPERCVSPFRGYLLAHVAAMKAIAHDWTHIEVPLVHPVYRFGGRPDRLGLALGLKSVLEGKSGQPNKADQIQTALQAILAASESGLPAEYYQRLALYWKKTGKFKLEAHKDRRDFDEAHRIIRICCNERSVA